METVIQKYLRSEFKTIHDYNEKAGEVAEPYRLVVIFDFPANFSDTAARRLASITRSGPRCGVYAIIVRNSSKNLPYGFEERELECLKVSGAPTLRETAEDPNWKFEVGQTYQCRVVSVKEFGAFVEASPGKAGLVHISELAEGRVRSTKDEVEVGDSVWVKCIGIEANGTVRLSRRAALLEQAEEERDNVAQEGRSKVAGEERLQWNSPPFDRWTLTLDNPPPEELLNHFIRASGERAKDAMRVEVPFDKLLGLSGMEPSAWWQGDSSKSLRVPLGPTGARRLQYLVLGEGLSHHSLIVGRPGSGKSNLMHVIITTLCLAYPPEELQLYLIDFKKGVEFKGYANHSLPHALAIAVESEREFGFSVIERLDLELAERGKKFRAQNAPNIAEFRGKTGERLPRILLIVDEFQELFSEDDKLAQQSKLLLDRLVSQGRAFGIHIMLGSQTLGRSGNLTRSTLDQMAIRIAMQCSEADSKLILADDNPAARLLSRPGEAIYNSSSGLIEGNNLFQVALFTDEDREQRLADIERMAVARGGDIPRPIVFEGNEMARLSDCRPLMRLLTQATVEEQRSAELFLGEPIAIRPPITARLRRQSGCHLLAISREEKEGVAVCLGSVISLLAQSVNVPAAIAIADFSTADELWFEYSRKMAACFPDSMTVTSRQRDVGPLLQRLEKEVRRRSDEQTSFPSLYLVLQGLHRIKTLRENEEDDDGVNAVELLGNILRDGPEQGVHVIAWADTWGNATRGLSRRMAGEFGLRVGMAMSAEDSNYLLDDPAASRLKSAHRAIYYDEEKPGQLTTFRPYSIPSSDWLESTIRQLAERIHPQPAIHERL